MAIKQKIKNDNLTIAEADEGNCTIIFQTLDYKVFA